MGTLMIFTVAILICAVLAGWLLRKRTKRLHLPWLHQFSGATTRKLTNEERQGIENYLDYLNQDQRVPASGATIAPAVLTLTPQSNTVFTLTRAITRYGITTDEPNKWRYFLDSVEVHLPRSGNSILPMRTVLSLSKLMMCRWLLVSTAIR